MDASRYLNRKMSPRHGLSTAWLIHGMAYPWHGLSMAWHGLSMAWLIHGMAYPWHGLDSWPLVTRQLADTSTESAPCTTRLAPIPPPPSGLPCRLPCRRSLLSPPSPIFGLSRNRISALIPSSARSSRRMHSLHVHASHMRGATAQHTHTHTRTHARTHVHARARTHTHAHTRARAHTHVNTPARIDAVDLSE